MAVLAVLCCVSCQISCRCFVLCWSCAGGARCAGLHTVPTGSLLVQVSIGNCACALSPLSAHGLAWLAACAKFVSATCKEQHTTLCSLNVCGWQAHAQQRYLGAQLACPRQGKFSSQCVSAAPAWQHTDMSCAHKHYSKLKICSSGAFKRLVAAAP